MLEIKMRHWLHILVCLLLCGLWLPVYIILIATTELRNREIRKANALINAAYERGLVEGRKQADDALGEMRRQYASPGFMADNRKYLSFPSIGE